MRAPEHYRPPPGAYDEAFDADGRVRPHYEELIAALDDPAATATAVSERVRSDGIAFGASGDGWFSLDPVPRLLTNAEWSEIGAGLAQRVRALDLFAHDVHCEARIVAAGVVPARAVESSVHFEPAMRDSPVPRGNWVSFAGLDLVRGSDGRFHVLEDQLRMPSGLAYAVASRDVLRAELPLPPTGMGEPSEGLEMLRRALLGAAPEGVDEPQVVVLSEGRSSAAWWEHALVGRLMDCPVVTLADLEHRGGRLHARVDDRLLEVHVVYQRTGEDRFTQENGEPTALGLALLEPCGSGSAACVNAPGSGVGDDKLLHAYVEEMVRFYLDEEPLLPSVPTYDLEDEPAREAALERLEELVIKPRSEMGGEGVVIWRDADPQTRERLEARIRASPAGLIAQERVLLSTHPTVCDGRLEPRHIDFRPYVVLSDDEVSIVAGGLSRVALRRGSLIVNSGQGGGAKDTWVPAWA